jgi:Domain of unknown function (DUF932)
MQAHTLQLLKDAAPAALATQPRPGLSTKYTFFSTRELVSALETENWTVVEAKQAGGRKSPLETRKHQLIIADKAQAQQKGIGEYPRVLLTNSHDGGGACKAEAGLWRIICSNGIVISDGFIQSVRVPHTRHTIEEVIKAAQGLRENAELIGEHVVKFREVKLTPAAQVEFAKLAIRLRFDGRFTGVVKPQDLLTLQRTADAGQSLWNTFNVVQEWLIKGGFPILEPRYFEAIHRKGRPVKSIDDSGRLNKGLWDLAEQFSLN